MPDTLPKISRQLAYKRRKLDAGQCTQCGSPALTTLCKKHMIEQRERVRARGGFNAHQPGGRGRPPKS